MNKVIIAKNPDIQKKTSTENKPLKTNVIVGVFIILVIYSKFDIGDIPLIKNSCPKMTQHVIMNLKPFKHSKVFYSFEIYIF